MPGDLVGLVGNTGHSFGSHLHFEIQATTASDSPIDPIPWLRKKGLPRLSPRPASRTAPAAQSFSSGAKRSTKRLTPSSPPKSTSACVLSPSPRVRTTVPRPKAVVGDPVARRERDDRPVARRAHPGPRREGRDGRALVATPDRRGARELALPVDELGGDLVEEPRRRVVLRCAPSGPDRRAGQVEPLAGPGDADVGEAALLLELLGVAEAAQVREGAVLHAGEEDDGELQPLGRVERHEGDDAGRPRPPRCRGSRRRRRRARPARGSPRG